MANYIENKKKLDEIKRKYFSQGDILFKTAMQVLIDCGRDAFSDAIWVDAKLKEIDTRHDKAEAEGKILFITRDFEKVIMECAAELSQINTYDLMIYIQKELYLGGDDIGEPDYQRAIQIIRDCLCYNADGFGAYRMNAKDTLDKFRYIGLSDDEIAYFGWQELLDIEDKEDY